MPNPAKTMARAALQKAGYEVRRRQGTAEEQRRARLMRSEGIDLVLDVGANSGDYALGLRRGGYGGAIVSFEPLSEAFQALTSHTEQDPAWTARRLALGEEDGSAEINIAANSWSSSLLPMRDQHLQSAPESEYVGTETVETARLESVWPEVAGGSRRPWLKLDVQGFEMFVLRGAGSRLAEVRGVQLELELVSLYEGDSNWREVVGWMGDEGFEMAGVEPGFVDPASGRMLQFDGLFIRGGA